MPKLGIAVGNSGNSLFHSSGLDPITLDLKRSSIEVMKVVSPQEANMKPADSDTGKL